MLQFIYDGDLLKVYKGFYSLKITNDFLKGRSEKAQDHLRDHVSSICYLRVKKDII